MPTEKLNFYPNRLRFYYSITPQNIREIRYATYKFSLHSPGSLNECGRDYLLLWKFYHRMYFLHLLTGNLIPSARKVLTKKGKGIDLDNFHHFSYYPNSTLFLQSACLGKRMKQRSNWTRSLESVRIGFFFSIDPGGKAYPDENTIF